MLRIRGLMMGASLVLVACLGAAIHPAGAQSSNPTPLVLAFYYTWFDETTWTPAKVSDMPVSLYASRDRAVMGQHIDQAKGAGIDALVVSWYGHKSEPNNQTEPNLTSLLEVAQEKGFKIAADFETASPFLSGQGDIVAALQHLMSAHASQPGYLAVDGKPVIFFWAIQRVPTAPGQSPLEAWRAIRQQVDPDRRALWIAEGVDIQYQDVFDGHHLYSVAWSKDVKRTLADWGSRVRKWSAAHDGDRRLWVATVMPGYNDLRTGRADAFVRERGNGQFYQDTWRAAMDSRADWVVITSFNEWVEGSQIEPSQAYGNLYLDLTRDWAAQFKSGQGAPVAEGAPPQASAPVSATLPVTPSLALLPSPTPAPALTPTVDAPTSVTAVPPVAPAAGPGATPASADTPEVAAKASRVAALVLTPSVTAPTETALRPGAEPSGTPSGVAETGRVVVARLAVRAGPGEDYAVVRFVEQGDALQVLGVDSDSKWIRVSVALGEEGFVPAQALVQASEPEAPELTELPEVLATPVEPVEAAVVVSSGSKLRKGPASRYGPITKLDPNDRLLVLGTNTGRTWLQVRVPGGQEGWVDARVVGFSETASPTSPGMESTVTLKPTPAPAVIASPRATVATTSTGAPVVAPKRTTVFYSAVAPMPSQVAVPSETPVITTVAVLVTTAAPSPSLPDAAAATTMLPPDGPQQTQAIAGGLLVLTGVAALAAAVGFGAMYVFSRR